MPNHRRPAFVWTKLIGGLAAALTLCSRAAPSQAPALAPLPSAAVPLDLALASADYRRQVEADWLLQATAEPLSTQTDARGACDGVKDGKYAFHTGHEANPWWQVDLGSTQTLARVVVFNRLDYAPGLHNTDSLDVLTSEDGQRWILRHQNRAHFGGISGAKPLEVTFPPPGLQARFVRLQIPSQGPIFLHLDEVEVYGPAPAAANLALHRPADQSSLSPWSTVKPLPLSVSRLYPIAAVIERGRRLAANLGKRGVDTGPAHRDLEALPPRLAALSAASSEAAWRQLYLDARQTVRRLAFSDPLLNFGRLLFVKRFTQESYPDVCLNHMPWVSRPGGDLCILAAAGGGSLFAALADLRPEAAAQDAVSLRLVLNRALGPGHVHGMDLWWDGDRVVFGYARARREQPPDGWLDRCTNYGLRRSEEATHLYEIALDGSGLRQLTQGEWSDLDPTYLPDGSLAFVSERCGTSLQCNEYDKDETSCNLYVMKADGSGIRRLSVNKDGDYLPHCLDNGLIGYTRWEYHERSFAFIQSLWVVRPDGTWADALFKQHFANPWALEDVRSIPSSQKLVAIATGHHTLAVGPVVIIDALQGINNPAGIGIVTPGVKPPEGGMDGATVPAGGVLDGAGFYSTPWPLSETHFLVAYSSSSQTTEPAGYGLYLIDVFGNKELIYRDPAISCFQPMPLRPRPRPPVLADTTDPQERDAIAVVSDVSYGVDGIAPERIRYLRIAEPIGWPYDNQAGGQRYIEDHCCLKPSGEKQLVGNWTPVRVLGDVPVEADGSACFRVPADTAVYFQLLDENHMELRRMRSFISFQPGERRACVGCHESREVAPRSQPQPAPLALGREPQRPQPPPWGQRPLSFLRDIQPVLDRRCVTCHTGLKPAGNLDLSGGLTCYDLAVPGYGYNRAYASLVGSGLVACSPARQQDASITPPLAYGSPRSKLVAALAKPPHVERARLDDDERLRLLLWIDANAPYHDRFVNKRPATPAYDLAADRDLLGQLSAIHERRCAACHKSADITRLDWIDIRQPSRSLFLTAPLAQDSGARGRCTPPVYADSTDPDYRAARALVEVAVARQWEHPRRDVAALKEDLAAAPAAIPSDPPAPLSPRAH
jgi:hypothetical protein